MFEAPFELPCGMKSQPDNSAQEGPVCDLGDSLSQVRKVKMPNHPVATNPSVAVANHAGCPRRGASRQGRWAVTILQGHP